MQYFRPLSMLPTVNDDVVEVSLLYIHMVDINLSLVCFVIVSLLVCITHNNTCSLSSFSVDNVAPQ